MKFLSTLRFSLLSLVHIRHIRRRVDGFKNLKSTQKQNKKIKFVVV